MRKREGRKERRLLRGRGLLGDFGVVRPSRRVRTLRRKALCGELRRNLGEVIRKPTEQKASHIEEEHLMPDHVHIMTNPGSQAPPA
jgi:hypothetical protein